MTVKAWVLLAFVVITGIKLLLQWMQYRSAGNAIPENVADVYDRETYLRWQRYHGEKSRLEMGETLTGAAVMAVLLVWDVHKVFAGLLGDTVQSGMFGVVLCQTLVDAVVSLPFGYVDTMKIEEKYGFNRSSGKTFVRDQLLNLVMEAAINSFIVWAMYFSHTWLGNAMAGLFAAVMCVFVLLTNLLFPLISRLQNTFTPLEEGSLRDKLSSLLTGHGYRVKGIQVMDASRRSTKLNAYFSGFGKQKRIVLYDTLCNTMEEDEICAVFAHELGHGLHRDIPKLLLMNCGNMVLIALVAWLFLIPGELYAAFGFSGVNYGFAYLLLGTVGLPLLSYLVGMAVNAVSRRAEYAADQQAVAEGYGTALISALKILARENFSHLSPSRLLVVLEYSHPPLSQRIAAVEAQQGSPSRINS